MAVRTKQPAFAFLAAGLGGLAVTARALVRKHAGPDSNVELMGSAGIRGALVGAQAGLMVDFVPGKTPLTPRNFGRASGIGAAIGLPVGLLMGGYEMASGTYGL